MIGRVFLPVEGYGEITVTLDNSGELHFSGYQFPEVEDLIRTQFQLYEMNYGAWRGPFGVEFLNGLARRFQGKAEIIRKPLKEGVVY